MAERGQLRIIAGRHRGRRLAVPPGQGVRPTADRARQALIDMLEHGEPPLRGARFLDLFAGTGAIGLEAASRGAAEVLLVEQSAAAARVARANIETLGEGARVRLLQGDACRLGRAPAAFDIVFLDPPYGMGLLPSALAGLLQGGWLAERVRIVCEIGEPRPPALPEGLVIEQERRHGRARLLCLGRAPSSDGHAAGAEG